MKEFKITKLYFGHLYFYYEPNVCVVPISALIDKAGITICVGFWGFSWYWKKEYLTK